VCRRQSSREAGTILTALHRAGITRLHGFGFKIAGLRRHGNLLASADSTAWSFQARHRPALPGCRHASCANCRRYALAWRDRVLAAATASVTQPALFGLDGGAAGRARASGVGADPPPPARPAPPPPAHAPRRTIVERIESGPCLAPVTVRCGPNRAVLPCGRTLPAIRQCANCRPVVEIRNVTTIHTGPAATSHTPAPVGLADKPCRVCGQPLAKVLEADGRHIGCARGWTRCPPPSPGCRTRCCKASWPAPRICGNRPSSGPPATTSRNGSTTCTPRPSAPGR